MKPYQAMGWSMHQTTAITAITSTRIYHGLRPTGTTVPAINYFEIGPSTRANGIERTEYTINCRASTAGASRDLARAVITLFAGAEGRGGYGTQNGFDIARVSLRNDSGLVPEVEDGIFNSPVDITLIYAVDTVA